MMRRLVVLAFVLLQWVFASSSFAAPCVSAPLSTYTAGGFSCSIGSLDFSSFNLVATIGDPFGSITINPVTVAPNQFGLQFVVNQTAATLDLFEQLIGYRVTGIGTLINRSSVFLTGSSTTGDAAVTAAEQLCLGGVFAAPDKVSGCTGTELVPSLAAIDTLGFLDSDQRDLLPGVSFLSVVSDIAVDGGTDGAGHLDSATNLFRAAAVPVAVVDEPSSGALALLAALLVFAKRRRAGASFTA
jgi:MYXO-CTERM domain-containing protein